MKKAGILGTFIVLTVILASAVSARPNTKPAEVGHPAGDDRYAAVTVPEHAAALAPALYDLGIAQDKDGRVVQGVMFIHYKKGYNHRPNHDKDPGSGKKSSQCYSFLASGAKWKTVEDYLVDPANTKGLDHAVVREILASAIDKWEDAANGAAGDGIGKNIIGNESAGAVDGADTSSPDGKNEIMFADIDSPGAIAVTIVWGIFYGPPRQRELVEWDQVYDDVDFDWSAEAKGIAGKMDFDNIVTHEHGHAFGLGHPDNACTEETMYRWADPAETKKRDLEQGDIKGVSELYK